MACTLLQVVGSQLLAIMDGQVASAAEGPAVGGRGLMEGHSWIAEAGEDVPDTFAVSLPPSDAPAAASLASPSAGPLTAAADTIAVEEHRAGLTGAAVLAASIASAAGTSAAAGTPRGFRDETFAIAVPVPAASATASAGLSVAATAEGVQHSAAGSVGNLAVTAAGGAAAWAATAPAAATPGPVAIAPPAETAIQQNPPDASVADVRPAMSLSTAATSAWAVRSDAELRRRQSRDTVVRQVGMNLSSLSPSAAAAPTDESRSEAPASRPEPAAVRCCWQLFFLGCAL